MKPRGLPKYPSQIGACIGGPRPSPTSFISPVKARMVESPRRIRVRTLLAKPARLHVDEAGCFLIASRSNAGRSAASSQPVEHNVAGFDHLGDCDACFGSVGSVRRLDLLKLRDATRRSALSVSTAPCGTTDHRAAARLQDRRAEIGEQARAVAVAATLPISTIRRCDNAPISLPHDICQRSVRWRGFLLANT